MPGALAQEPDSPVLRPAIEKYDRQSALSLTGAVETARKYYPSIQRKSSDILRARAEVTVARTEYLPRMDMLLQELRASQNITEGTILPQFLNVIPIQSGAPAHSSTFNSFFGSNAGLNFSWELVDFGRRAANVRVAQRGLDNSMAHERLTELDVESRAAACYLTMLAAQQQILACQGTLDRMQDWALVVHTLCDKGLRPGVDAYRADSQVSMAKIALIDAHRQTDLAQQDLAQAIGRAGVAVETIAGPFTKKRDGIARPAGPFVANLKVLENHPLSQMRMTEVDISKAKIRLLDKTWYPHLWLESGIWGRGAGTSTFIKPVASGVVPKTANWAVGFTLQFPVMQYFKVRAEKTLERAQMQARLSSYELAMQELIKEDGKARVMLDRALETAAETPVLVHAAKENEVKARERYRVGLTNVIEVAEAEQILARAESENAVAQINVWKAQLAVAYAHGDLQPFLRLVALAEAEQ